MIKTTPVDTIKCWDLDELVTTTYGKPYDFQSEEEGRDRGFYRFVVKNDDVSVCFEQENPIPLDEWLKDTSGSRLVYPLFDELILDLKAKGLIKDGDYYIVVDW